MREIPTPRTGPLCTSVRQKLLINRCVLCSKLGVGEELKKLRIGSQSTTWVAQQIQAAEGAVSIHVLEPTGIVL